MKNLILVLGFIFISTAAFAQKRNDLKGPKHKNFKPWEHKAEPTLFYVGSDKKGLKSPEFKNYKPWQNKNKTSKIVATASTRPKVTGPKYKNYKPWKNSH